MFDFTVEVRDANLVRLGQILPEDLNLELADFFNNVGEWTLKLPIGHPLVPALRTPGAGIIVTIASGPLAGTPLASGPMVSPEVNVSKSDPGTVTIVGATDAILLADRRAHPAPVTLDPADASHDVRTGPAETLMVQYANVNLSAGAHATRQDSRVVVPASLGRGDSTTKRARFPVLGSLLAEIAAGANYPTSRPASHPGHLGFRLIQVDDTLEFQVYQVADRSAEVRLDVENGTLSSNKLATAAPTVTHVVVAGSGEGADRSIVERTTTEAAAAATAWRRRIELLKDARNTGDTAELQQAGDEELAKGGLSQFAIQVTPGEDTGWEFGSDWGLGDLVTVVVRDGGDDALAATEYGTIVTGYVLKADASGRRMGAILGQPQESGQQSIERRLANLEANAEAPAPYVLPADITTSSLVLTKTTDASASAGNAPALRIGSTSGTHLRIDGNEIIPMSSDTAPSALFVGETGGGGLTVSGTQMTLRNANSSPTKQLRASNDGSETDLQAGGAALHFSTFTNADFSGTQNTKIILPKTSAVVSFPQGAASSVAASAANDLTRKTDVETMQSAYVTPYAIVNGASSGTFSTGFSTVDLTSTAASSGITVDLTNNRIQIVTAGLYWINAQAGFAAAAGNRGVFLYLNGATYIASNTGTATTGDSLRLQVSRLYRLSVGDTIALQVWTNGAVAMESTLYGGQYLEAHRVCA